MNCTWQVLKKITGKSKLKSKRFLKSINVNGKTIKKFNKSFTNVGSNVVSKIQKISKTFEDF